MLAAHVVSWESADRVVVYDPTTGRHAQLDRTSLHPMPGAVRERLGRLGMIVDFPIDRSAMIACRSRLPLVRADRAELWHPHPMIHTSGGHAWVARSYDRSLWDAINGARTVRQLATSLGRSVDDVLTGLAAWTAADVQAVQLREARPSPSDPSLARVVGPARSAGDRTPDQHAADGATDLVAYHLAIDDGPVHFDDRETTIAHAFGLPHPALGGRTYGDALYDALGREGFWPPPGPVVEVGCGDGEVADALSRRIEQPYLRVDLSPGLLATQRARAPRSLGVLGDARRLPLRDGCVDRLLSNEVIADLPAVPVGAEQGGAQADEVRAWLAGAGLGPPSSRRWYNLGAWQFIAEIARVLAPGGRAWVSEFGSPEAPPEEAVQLDHPEVGIHFGELAAIARAAGLQTRLVRLDEWLGFVTSARQLWREHHRGLRAMCRAAGVHLPARAWTPEQLAQALPFAVEGLAWVPLSEPGAGPMPGRFFALVVTRPR